MTKMETCLMKNKMDIECRENAIASNRINLIEALRSLANHIERDENRPIVSADASWFNTYIANIEEATKELKALKEQKAMLEFLAKED